MLRILATDHHAQDAPIDGSVVEVRVRVLGAGADHVRIAQAILDVAVMASQRRVLIPDDLTPAVASQNYSMTERGCHREELSLGHARLLF
jgi:hypothetical protein